MTTRTVIYIGGSWTAPASAGTIEVENPATEQVFGAVPAGTVDDVDAAVDAARSALDTWATAQPAARAAALARLAAAVERRAGEFAAMIATEVGCPVRVATKVQTAVPVQVLRSCIELAAHHPLSETIGNSLVVKEPVGVVGAITPWNYPLQQVVAKLGPALAAGCTVVLKPSELTPLTAYVLFDAIGEAGLPPGVVNLVPGTGPEVGAALAAHAGVDMVSFTGSTAVGRSIGSVVAGRVARVALELGGKSANVVLDDADVTAAVKVGVANALLNSGQTCTAWTRMLVHRSRYDEAVTVAAKAAASMSSAIRSTRTPGWGRWCRRSSESGSEGMWNGRRWRAAGHRWSRCASAGRRLLRRPDDLRRRGSGQPPCAGGDLRPGTRHHSVRGRRRRGSHRE